MQYSSLSKEEKKPQFPWEALNIADNVNLGPIIISSFFLSQRNWKNQKWGYKKVKRLLKNYNVSTHQNIPTIYTVVFIYKGPLMVPLVTFLYC